MAERIMHHSGCVERMGGWSCHPHCEIRARRAPALELDRLRARCGELEAANADLVARLENASAQCDAWEPVVRAACVWEFEWFEGSLDALKLAVRSLANPSSLRRKPESAASIAARLGFKEHVVKPGLSVRRPSWNEEADAARDALELKRYRDALQAARERLAAWEPVILAVFRMVRATWNRNQFYDSLGSDMRKAIGAIPKEHAPGMDQLCRTLDVPPLSPPLGPRDAARGGDETMAAGSGDAAHRETAADEPSGSGLYDSPQPAATLSPAPSSESAPSGEPARAQMYREQTPDGAPIKAPSGDVCTSCGGSGWLWMHKRFRCGACRGTGRAERQEAGALVYMSDLIKERDELRARVASLEAPAKLVDAYGTTHSERCECCDCTRWLRARLAAAEKWKLEAQAVITDALGDFYESDWTDKANALLEDKPAQSVLLAEKLKAAEAERDVLAGALRELRDAEEAFLEHDSPTSFGRMSAARAAADKLLEGEK